MLLQNREHDFCALAEKSPDIVIRYGRDGRRLYINPSHERLSGIPATALIGRTPSDTSTLSDDMVKSLEQAIACVVGSGRETELLLRWNGMGAKQLCFLMHLMPEFDHTGNVVSVLSVSSNISELQWPQTHLSDISALKDSQRRLEVTQARLGQLIDAIPDLVWLKDGEGVLQFCNPAAEALLGASAAEIVGKTECDFFSAENAERFRQADREAALSGQITTLEEWFTFARDGRHALLEIRKVPVRDTAGNMTGMLSIARDITALKQAETRLKRNELALRMLAQNLPDAIARYDHSGCVLYTNSAFTELTGLQAEQVRGKKPGEFTYFPDDIAHGYLATLIEAMQSGKAADFTLAWNKGDGEAVCLHVRAVPEWDANGNVSSILTISSDITQFKEVESIARLGHWQWDYQHQCAVISEGLSQLLALPRNFAPSWQELLERVTLADREMVKASIRSAYHGGLREISLEFRVHAGDRVLDAHSTLRFDYDARGKLVRSLGTLQDVSELRRYQRQLQTLAFYDALTELPNRALFNDRIAQALHSAAHHQHLAGLMLLDLDNFKTINDAFGHGMGDQLLCQVATRLRQAVSECDTVARLGGDEFALILPEMSHSGDLESMGQKLLDALSKPYWLNGQELFISASIGIAHYPQDGGSVADLLQFADLAMYQAKALGRNNFQFYTPRMLNRASERLALAADLRHAVDNNELVLFYQPQVDIVSSAVIGAEALLRWRHPEKGLLTPDRFISIAEETGQIVPIGEWVLKTACLAASAWNLHQTCGQAFKVAVNLSVRQFKQNDLVSSVKRILQETNCQADWLELEITESLLLDDSLDVRRILDELRGLGLVLAIDDFGTGYSALGYLKRFPVQVIKVDRSFINDITSNEDSAALVKAIIFMAHSLRLHVVAEGVETCAQQLFLAEHQCGYGQGYLFGKPMPREMLEAVIAEANAKHCASVNGHG